MIHWTIIVRSTEMPALKTDSSEATYVALTFNTIILLSTTYTKILKWLSSNRSLTRNQHKYLQSGIILI